MQVAEMKRKFPRFAASAIDDMEVNTLPWQTAAASQQEPTEQLPEAGPSRPICDTIHPDTRKTLSALWPVRPHQPCKFSYVSLPPLTNLLGQSFGHNIAGIPCV